MTSGNSLDFGQETENIDSASLRQKMLNGGVADGPKTILLEDTTKIYDILAP